MPLGVLMTTVALVALIAGLATELATSSVTGIGAGMLLTVFAAAALASIDVETATVKPTTTGRSQA